MGSPPAPHPGYVVTLADSGPGAGPGIPGAVVRDAVTGRVVDRVPGHPDMYLSVAGTGDNRVFFLGVGSGPFPPSPVSPGMAGAPVDTGAFMLRIDDAGKVAGLSPVPGVPQRGGLWLAATADGTRVAFPVRHGRGPPAPLGSAGSSPAEIHIVAVATGERSVWRAGSDGFVSNLSFSADGGRLAYSWHGAEGSGIRVLDLPRPVAGQVLTAPSRLVVPEKNSLGNLGRAVISPDGSSVYVTAARYGAGGRPETRLAEVSASDGQLLRIVYGQQGADPGNIVFGWGPVAIDPSGQHALIAYAGNLARIDLRTGGFTEIPIDVNWVSHIAW